MHPMDQAAIGSRDDWATWYQFYDQEAEFITVTQALEEGDKVFLDDLEVVGTYFGASYQEKFDELIKEFLERRIIYVEDGRYRAIIKP